MRPISPKSMPAHVLDHILLLFANFCPSRSDSSKFRPNNATIAGSANKRGGVYERLAKKDNYTGVGLRVALDEMVVNKFNPILCPSNFPV